MSKDKPFRVLFICSANMCRSPMAKGYLEKLIYEKGLESVMEVDSAAVFYNSNLPATTGAKQIAKSFGFNLDFHISKYLTNCLFERADLIFVMTLSHRHEILSRFSTLTQDKVQLLGQWDPENFVDPQNLEILDPYASNTVTYDAVFKQIKRSIDNWLMQGIFAKQDKLDI